MEGHVPDGGVPEPGIGRDDVVVSATDALGYQITSAAQLTQDLQDTPLCQTGIGRDMPDARVGVSRDVAKDYAVGTEQAPIRSRHRSLGAGRGWQRQRLLPAYKRCIKLRQRVSQSG
jgi:hypothetical protein